MKDQIIKNKIKNIVNLINPHDPLEKEHIRDTLNWISSDANIFRIKKDAVPPKHLVSYSVVVSPHAAKVLLFDHKRAKLMLPSGGHINTNEMPLDAAKRELKEELGLSLEIYPTNQRKDDIPFFVTVTQTVGINEPHIDVSLWYLFTGDSTRSFKKTDNDYNKEFENYYWLGFDKVLSLPVAQFDPHMHRFVQKIKNLEKPR